jgi:hypothetical protein
MVGLDEKKVEVQEQPRMQGRNGSVSIRAEVFMTRTTQLENTCYSRVYTNNLEQDPLAERIRGEGESGYKKYGISQDDLENAYDEACSLSLQDARAILAEYLSEHGFVESK